MHHPHPAREMLGYILARNPLRYEKVVLFGEKLISGDWVN